MPYSPNRRIYLLLPKGFKQMAQKRIFHCNTCAKPCTVYKKGKKHRVLVCPSCGVLATNPFSFGRAAGGASAGAAVGSVIPGAGTAVGAALGGIIGGFGGSSESKESQGGATRPPNSRSRLNALDWANRALAR